jgi:hypothetical protein
MTIFERASGAATGLALAAVLAVGAAVPASAAEYNISAVSNGGGTGFNSTWLHKSDLGNPMSGDLLAGQVDVVALPVAGGWNDASGNFWLDITMKDTGGH